MNYFIDIRGKDKNTADIKAPADMCHIMSKRGYTPIVFERTKKKGRNIGSFLCHVKNWLRAFAGISSKSLLVYQYPIALSKISIIMMKTLVKIKKLRLVFLIHDIDSLRNYNASSNSSREKLFKECAGLICHNESMKRYLVEQGIDEKKIVPLYVFDYINEDDFVEIGNDTSVIIAGNLNTQKSKYIDALLKEDRGFHINLYGPNFVEKPEYKDYTYFGSFPPEQLCSHLKGSFGLVWDGDSIDECSGPTGRYLQYNNPHKVSLYISSGIPVIIWDKAALSKYISDNSLGYSVGSLRDVANLISTGVDDLNDIKRNVIEEGKRLREGDYLNQALDKIEQM